mmetsp:Transcript_52658/g.125811  ORF Transcript_52658/g.125811 Transcript_52658/m.125811 type:complete len:257 (+) Transcript_52658:384-1154(+)
MSACGLAPTSPAKVNLPALSSSVAALKPEQLRHLPPLQRRLQQLQPLPPPSCSPPAPGRCRLLHQMLLPPLLWLVWQQSRPLRKRRTKEQQDQMEPCPALAWQRLGKPPLPPLEGAAWVYPPTTGISPLAACKSWHSFGQLLLALVQQPARAGLVADSRNAAEHLAAAVAVCMAPMPLLDSTASAATRRPLERLKGAREFSAAMALQQPHPKPPAWSRPRWRERRQIFWMAISRRQGWVSPLAGPSGSLQKRCPAR